MNIDWIKSCADLGAKLIKVIKPYRDVDLFLEESQEAIDAGCIAIGSDIIHAYSEDGGYDSRRECNGPRSSEELRLIGYINRTTGEVRHYMNRTNSPDVKHIDPTVIHKADF